MSSNELNELHENCERARHDSSIAPVTMTMVVIAVFVAIVSIVGHRTHTKEVLKQDELSNKWGHYQAKVIRGTTAQMFSDLTSVFQPSDAARTDVLRTKFQSEADRYQTEKKEIEEQATGLKLELEAFEHKAKRIDLAEVLLEISLVITSITLLSSIRIFWYGGMIVGVLGVGFATYGYLGF